MPAASTRRTLLLIAGTLVVAGAWLAARHLTSHRNEPTAPPLASAPSPYLNVDPHARYVGIAKCAECHRDQAASYGQTGHSEALSVVDRLREPEPGRFVHSATGIEHKIYEAAGAIHHRQSLTGPDGEVVAAADYPVSYLIGSGRHTRSYLVEDDGFLLQSPITWYASHERWDLSPGYAQHPKLGFGRAVGTDCLTCHAGAMNANRQQFRGLAFTEAAIGCERCHGPGSLHVEFHERPEASRTSDGSNMTIVNPSMLSRTLLESICADCHLQGAASARVRGRSHDDFRPGLPLSHFRVEFQSQDANKQMTVVGHFEQMRQSRCYLESDTLTCTTCHAMHESPSADKAAYFQQKCLQCHETESCGSPMPQRLAESPEDNCIECHMPTSDTEIPHVAFTHHRIAVHQTAAAQSPQEHTQLAPMQDISHLPQADQDRCRGLAYLQWSETNLSEAQATKAREQARLLLATAHDHGIQDGETLSALATLFYGQNNDVAKGLAQQAIQSTEIGDKARARSLFVLADLQYAGERYEAAASLLEEVVALRRVYEDWLLLGMCRLATGRTDLAIHAWQQAQHIDPYRPAAHEYLARAYMARNEDGDRDRAQHHQASAASLLKPSLKPSLNGE